MSKFFPKYFSLTSESLASSDEEPDFNILPDTYSISEISAKLKVSVHGLDSNIYQLLKLMKV